MAGPRRWSWPWWALTWALLAGACLSPDHAPPLPAEVAAAPGAVILVRSEEFLDVQALPPGFGGPLTLPPGADLEVRTFTCPTQDLGLGLEPYRIRGSPAAEDCLTDGAPCGLARLGWRPGEVEFSPRTLAPNLPWPVPRISAYPALVTGPVAEVRLPGLEGKLQDGWVQPLGAEALVVASPIVGTQDGGTLFTVFRVAELDPLRPLEVVRTTTTSTTWIGGRRLPDGRVAMIGNRGASGFLEPEDLRIELGPSLPRDRVVCSRPGGMEPSLRGDVDFSAPVGGELELWAATSCGGVLRRSLSDLGWTPLGPLFPGGNHAHLLVIGPGHAFIGGIGRNAVVHVQGDRVDLEEVGSRMGEVEYVGLGPEGQVVAASNEIAPNGAHLYVREARGEWTAFLHSSLGGGRAFVALDDGILMTTGIQGAALIHRYPDLPLDNDNGRVGFRGGFLATALLPLGPRQFVALVYLTTEARGTQIGLSLVVAGPSARCDR